MSNSAAEREPAAEFQLSPSERAAHKTALNIAGAARSPRSTMRVLAAIVLGFELIIVVLIGLAIFGLGITEPRWLGLVIGGGLAMLCLLALALIRFAKIGFIVGWIAHALMFATAFLMLPALFVALVFTALWVFALVRGKQLDNSQPPPPGDPSSG